MLKQLLSSVREYKKPSLLAPLTVALEVIAECLIPFLTAGLINAIQNGAGMQEILPYGFGLLAMALLSLTFGIMAGYFCSVASCGFAKNLRRDLFYKIGDFSFANIDSFSTSSLVTRLTTDVSNVQHAYMMLVRTAIRCPFMLIFAFFMSIRLGGELSLVFAVVLPILAFALFFIISRAMPLFRRLFKKYDKLNESVQENIAGMRVVKTFVREEYEKEKFGAASEELCRDFTRAEKLLAFNDPVMKFCMYTSMLLLSYFASRVIITNFVPDVDGVMNVGNFTGMITYSMQILISMMMVSMVFVMVTMAIESARRIAEVLSTESDLHNPNEPLYEVADGSIEFDHVSFRYAKTAERDTLQDIHLSIRSGETIGIMGGTGSSKSTLVSLISRLYDATGGCVRVGGRDVREYDLETLRNEVAVVLQKNVLFSGTIKENLRWGNPEATDEELVRACKLAQAHDFIMTFPAGYDTYIEQGGANVSGGQKQRLCIARALLKNPKILILDDSTSAVDTRTDALIRRAMREEIPGTTKIIIAQRAASVEDADRILLLDGGRVVACGPHAELLESSPIYREVYASQNKTGGNE